MMLAKIKQISDSAYNFKEALHQATLSQDDVDCFRKMVDLQEAVPKTILDKQVNFVNFCAFETLINFQSILASSISSGM